MEARFACDSFWMGMVCNSPCFRCRFVLNYKTHYTMLFDICQTLNEINRGYLPRKGAKGSRWIMNFELRNIEFRRGGNSFLQDLQDGRDFCGGKRFAGVWSQEGGSEW